MSQDQDLATQIFPNFCIIEGMERMDEWEESGIWDGLEEEEERQEALEAKETIEQAIAKCGTWYQAVSPQTGVPYSFQHQCNKWSRCPMCRSRKAEDERTRIMDAMNDAPILYEAQISSDEWQAVAKRLSRNGIEHRRIEKEDGTTWLLLNAREESLDLTPRTMEELSVTYFEDQLKDARIGSRPSGKLGVRGTTPGATGETDDPTTPSDKVTVKISAVACDAPAVLKAACWREVMYLTEHFDPKDKNHVISYCNTRAMLFQHLIRANGGDNVNISVKHIKVNVQISTLDWPSNIHVDIRTQPDGLKGELKTPELVEIIPVSMALQGTPLVERYRAEKRQRLGC